MKEVFYHNVIKYRKFILAVFFLGALISVFAQNLVVVNYDMNDYLPDSTASTVALDVMQEEFEGGIPNARVMIRGVTVPEALEYKEKLKTVEGVEEVTWLDDMINIKQPLEMQDADTVEAYYKDNSALYSLTIDEDKTLVAVPAIRELIGDENAMSGSAVSTAIATAGTSSEVAMIAAIAVVFVWIVLLFTTNSWAEPFVILIGLGIAILINNGTNLIFGEISFVTNAAGSILQLAVSLDYCVFLIHRFEECRREYEPEEAMLQALCKSTSSILSSGLTTVIGFLALALMEFKIGPDLGLALAKGVAISLITVFVFVPGFVLVSYKWMDKTKHRSFVPDFTGFGKVVSQVALPLVLVFGFLIVPSYLSSNNNDYYYGASFIFGEGTQLGDDTRAIEDVFGKGDTYVLLVPRGNTAVETELSAELKEIPEVTSIVSFVDMAGAEIPYEYLDETTLSLLESENYSRMVIALETDLEGEKTFNLVQQIRTTAEEYYPGTYHLAGEGVSTYDLMDTITADMVMVNLIAIGAVFAVLLLSMKNIALPAVLVLTIETAIWINLSIPYYAGEVLFYITYLIISSVQLGATVDYAILLTDRYCENREMLGKKESLIETISNVTVSILTSGSALTVVGFLLGAISSHGILSQLGYLLGKGTLCSLVCVFFVLPGLLYLLDRTFIKKKLEKMA